MPTADPALTDAQRAVLAAWPAFEAAAAVTWCSVDRLVRTLCHRDSLADLPDDDAAELLALMQRATDRLHGLRPASPQRGSA
ncbi:hypothetical protein TSH100_13960 [Azospirillum sp. TSH100]|uniref:hypothetical protein n=1 Tax=Azospirillum sp. TSH100 TaxID=652764 RepID=UPI000D60C62E|nr:hypothetical protein [Azospirillum sp. TSH100]PWC86072.1 hypothetical protein TSH100_13960 [Azospirillum sp. TSH100]QCG89347.1 hypothetical protein E6C72_16280 [Azospirillum sp. TSH100]